MTQTHEIDVVDLVDRRKLNAFNIRLMALSFFVVLVDGFDITVAAFAVPELKNAWHITSSAAFTPVLSLSLVGILLGSPLFGWVGDRYGRKTAIVFSYITFGVFTLGGAWSSSIWQLAILRLIAGIGIGGLLPNIVALNAEFAARRFQATAVIVTFTGVAFGGALPGPIAAFLAPHYGWEVLFYFGGIVPLVIAVVIAIWLPESIRFLALRDRQADIERLVGQMDPGTHIHPGTRFTAHEHKHLSFRHLFSDKLAVMTPLLWLLFALNLMAYFFLISWMPTLLGSAKIPLAQAALATAVLQFGGVIGSWTIARPTDRYGMAPIMILFLLGIPVVGSIGYIGLKSSTFLMLIVFCAGFCTLGIQMGLNAISALLYPTALRSTGSGWAFGVGRVGSILGPVIGGVLIAKHMPVPQLYMIAAIPFVFGAIACFFLMQLYAEKRRLEAAAQAQSSIHSI